MARLLTRLKNRYVWALIFISLLVVTLVIAAFIPQFGQETAHDREVWFDAHPAFGGVGKWLGIDDLATSWWILVLVSMLALLLAYDFILRLSRLTRTVPAEGTPVQTRRVRWGLYGSLFFHLSLLVLLIGAVADLVWGYHGTIYLTEGQIEREEEASYAFVRSGILGTHRGFMIRHEELDPAYAGFGNPMSAARVSFAYPQALAGDRWIAVNRPARIEGVRVYLGGEAGYTPHFEIWDTTGAPRRSAFVRLAAQKTPQGIEHGDWLPDLGEERLYCRVEEGDPARLMLELTSSPDAPVLRGSLTAPGAITLGALRVQVSELRRWARFELSCHPGQSMVFAGFWGAVIGLVWRFAFPRPQPRGES